MTWSGLNLGAITMIAGSAASSRLSWTCTVCFETPEVAVLNVAAILAQMEGDTVGSPSSASAAAQTGSGSHRAASLPERGDVVDIDAQLGHGELSLILSLRDRK